MRSIEHFDHRHIPHIGSARSMHQTALRHVVGLNRPVLNRAIVPHQEVPGSRLVAIDEGRPDDMISKRGDQHLGCLSPDPFDPGAIVAHGIEAFARGSGMGSDDRTGDRRIAQRRWRRASTCV